jgi:hypothetical protein
LGITLGALGMRVRAEGIVVVNPIHIRRLHWDEIDRFVFEEGILNRSAESSATSPRPPLRFIAALPGLRIHDLRYTAVALWIAAGGNPKAVSTATATSAPAHRRGDGPRTAQADSEDETQEDPDEE